MSDQGQRRAHDAAVAEAVRAVEQHEVLTSPLPVAVALHVEAAALAYDPCWCSACFVYREALDNDDVERARQRMADALRPYL